MEMKYLYNSNTSHVLSFETMQHTLDAAILERLCVKAWLGHANTLLLGFGDEVLPPPTLVTRPGRKPIYKHQGHPDYEIQTEFAEWHVENEGKVIASRSDDRRTQEALSLLVGKKATGWKIIPSIGELHIDFAEGLTLEIVPYNPMSDNDAWGIWNPDGFFSSITSNGTMYKRHGSTLV